MTRLWPYVLVLVALSLLLCAALVNRIDDVEVETVPHQLNPSPSDGEPASYSYVLPTTTTTAPPAPKHNLSRKTRGELFDAAMGSVNGYPCGGGGLPPCRVLRCESGGDPTARNPRSSASGLWQILRSTWDGFGGFAEAWLAPAEVQNEKARALWANGRGASHWRSCL